MTIGCDQSMPDTHPSPRRHPRLAPGHPARVAAALLSMAASLPAAAAGAQHLVPVQVVTPQASEVAPDFAP